MNRATRVILAGVGLGMMAACAVLQGMWTERWSDLKGPEIRRFVSQLVEVPMSMGDWEGTDLDADPDALAAAGADGCVYRRYQNHVTGQSADLQLVCGSPRHIAIHTPNECFVAAGYKMDTDQIRKTIQTSAGTAEFYTARFSTSVAGARSYLRVYWSWSVDGTWVAPTAPKVEMARQRALYKLYLISPIASPSGDARQSAAADLARDVVPELTAKLFSGEEPAVGGDNAASQAASPLSQESGVAPAGS